VSLHVTDAREIEEAYSWLNRYWHRSTRPIYHEAASFNEAVSLLDEYRGEAKILAGGIDLIGLMKNRVASPRALVNIKTIRHLDDVAETADGLHIRALTLFAILERSTLLGVNILFLRKRLNPWVHHRSGIWQRSEEIFARR